LRGYVLTTTFSLIDADWVDDTDSYPLYYSFYYSDPSDIDQKQDTITAGSLYPTTSTMLPEVRITRTEEFMYMLAGITDDNLIRPLTL